jgi:hypothetical protein
VSHNVGELAQCVELAPLVKLRLRGLALGHLGREACRSGFEFCRALGPAILDLGVERTKEFLSPDPPDRDRHITADHVEERDVLSGEALVRAATKG